MECSGATLWNVNTSCFCIAPIFWPHCFGIQICLRRSAWLQRRLKSSKDVWNRGVFLQFVAYSFGLFLIDFILFDNTASRFKLVLPQSLGPWFWKLSNSKFFILKLVASKKKLKCYCWSEPDSEFLLFNLAKQSVCYSEIGQAINSVLLNWPNSKYLILKWVE